MPKRRRKIYTEHAHRMKIHGMGKSELVDLVYEHALARGVRMAKTFLASYIPPDLYAALMALQHGHDHWILRAWHSHQNKKVVQGKLPF